MKGTKITTNNYFDTIDEVGFENLPLVLKQSHMVIMTKTDMGNDWSRCHSDADLKRMINLAFKKLEELINSENDYPDNSQIKKLKPEYDFIKRFLELHNTTKTHGELKAFLNQLVESIEQKKIRKTSPVANEIMFIQNALIVKSKGMASSKIKLALKDSTIQTMEDALQLISEQNIPKENKPPKKKPDNKNLNGLTETEQKPETSVNLMKSTDFANLQFNTIGFKDKWLSFIGDPAPGFTAMVFGMPKMGKSYLCVDFAGYLARNHGRVLYVAKEEKLDKTLQDKLNDKNVAHENLDIADALPKDLNGYDFIFLDSVNKLGLSPQDLEKLKAENKGRSFIYIFQATKNGKFKGNNEFQHDVDVVIEVPEQGKAVQFGRFNQGGELDIFGDNNVGMMEELNGVRKSGKNLDIQNKVSNVGSMKKKENQEQDWTNHLELHSTERSHLIRIKNLFEEGNMKEAMRQAAFLDTYLREMIPPKVWVEMGGELTEKGLEKLRLSSDFASRPDDVNPKYIFTQTATALLVEALRGDFDLKALIRQELANRGQDEKGNWVGFEQAAKVHKIKK